MSKLVLLASGSGSNVENIYNYFKDDNDVEISCVLTNRKNAGIIGRCYRLGIPLLYYNKTAFEGTVVTNLLKSMNPDLIVLAGFLQKVPDAWVTAFPKKIINIHPALLPNFGGEACMVLMYIRR